MTATFLRVPVLTAWLAFCSVQGAAFASEGEVGTADACGNGSGAVGYLPAGWGEPGRAPAWYPRKSPDWDAEYLCGAASTASSAAYLSTWRNGSGSFENVPQPSGGAKAEQAVIKRRIASTKIPGSAWLVASGILCLIGLKRKK